MNSLVLEVLKRYGFPTLAAIALAYYVWHLDARAAHDRDTYTKFLWDQINDVQIDLHTLQQTCKR